MYLTGTSHTEVTALMPPKVTVSFVLSNVSFKVSKTLKIITKFIQADTDWKTVGSAGVIDPIQTELQVDYEPNKIQTICFEFWDDETCLGDSEYRLGKIMGVAPRPFFGNIHFFLEHRVLAHIEITVKKIGVQFCPTPSLHHQKVQQLKELLQKTPENIVNYREFFKTEIQGKNLDKKGLFGKPNPYIKIYGLSPQKHLLRTSEALIKTQNPKFNLGCYLEHLCDNDTDTILRFEVHNRDGSNDYEIGFFETSVSKIIKQNVHYVLQSPLKKNKKVGEFVFQHPELFAEKELVPNIKYQQVKDQLKEAKRNLMEFNFQNFEDLESVILLGTAKQSGSALRLTPNANECVGGAWYLHKLNLSNGFVSNFKFKITGRGAHGLAFVIQNHSPTALGSSGVGLGYATIPKSLAVEFDTFERYDESMQPNLNHISIQTAGGKPNSSCVSFSIASNKELHVYLADQREHNVKIKYIDGQLSVYLDKVFVLGTKIDLLSKLETPDGLFWIGLTASTGDLSEAHDILSWNAVLK